MRNGQTDGWMDERMDRRTDRRMDGQRDGQTDGKSNIYRCVPHIKRPVLMLIFSTVIQNHGTKITYTSQFVLMSCPRHFVLMFRGTVSLAFFLTCS